MSKDQEAALKDVVKSFYDRLGERRLLCCDRCSVDMNLSDIISVGYSPREVFYVPPEARVSLGCGNPTALAELRPGERVIDVGSGAGLDLFLAARKVGREGLVVGLDISPAMVQRAKKAKLSFTPKNVELILSEAEHIPYREGSFDVAISNCTVNLCPDKFKVFKEIYRVLKKGGRLCLTDIICIDELGPEVRQSAQLWAACVAGTVSDEEYIGYIRDAGFSDVKLLSRRTFRYGPSDVSRFRQYFKDDIKGFKMALSLDGKLGSIALLAYKA